MHFSYKINVAPSEAKVSRDKETNLDINRDKKVKSIIPKPIMLLEILDVTQCNKFIESECDPNFMIEITGRWGKITSEALNIKQKIVKFLKGRRSA